MIVGIDVTHPDGLSINGAPSVAAVMASVDGEFARYPVSFRVQDPRVEIVQAIRSMIRERLELWKTENGGVYPENILIYRDGVSEGQYAQVLTQELAKIKEEIDSINPAPKVSYIVAGKRHHTRFYPTNPAHADGKGNTKPGTIVDRGITMERGWDFYLQPHTAFQGTVKPAHYVVIQDGMGIGVNELEKMVGFAVQPPHIVTDRDFLDSRLMLPLRPLYHICICMPPSILCRPSLYSRPRLPVFGV